ncbi:hypothetical protein [Dechloromonas denitrificans]|uniref:hypothetical protein n=1 Tax=Dechloromonas denitrificans TaxID=281362 RepID=UPI001CFB3147|nr:hypothetical protein [Dechloromonas denitrificans]UCV09138.1 hypothetical protein KI615_06315 [Dechloromonas denitrificans]
MNDASRADDARVALLIRGLLAIGRPMPMPARAFYVAWLYRFPQIFLPELLAGLASAIKVNELPREAIMFVEWINAANCGDSSRRLLIEEWFGAAGVWDSALAALDAGITALRLMNENGAMIDRLCSGPLDADDAQP